MAADRAAKKSPVKKAAKKAAKKAGATAKKAAATPSTPAVVRDSAWVRRLVEAEMAPFRLDEDALDGDLMRDMAGAVAVKMLTGILTEDYVVKDAGQAITVAKTIPRLMVDLAMFDAADELDKLSPEEARQRAVDFAEDLRRKRGA